MVNLLMFFCLEMHLMLQALDDISENQMTGMRDAFQTPRVCAYISILLFVSKSDTFIKFSGD